MKVFLSFRRFARNFNPNQAYESFKKGFKEEENKYLKDKDFFKDYEEVIETNTVINTRGMLTICPTPIGNLKDISIRQYQAIKSADILACEDTRLTGLLIKLLNNLTFAEAEALEFPPKNLENSLEIDEYSLCLGQDFVTHTLKSIKATKESKGRGIMVSFNSYNQEQRTPKLIAAMKSGIRVVLLTDAGTPLVSDPGFSLVTASIKNGLSIESLPGPVAAITALTLSGFSTENFFFAGYMPKVASEKTEKLVRMKKSGSTCIVYESSHRIINTLEKICEVFGDMHNVFVAQEMTKIYEKHYRGNAMDVLNQLIEEEKINEKIYGELTVVIDSFVVDKSKNLVEIDVKHMMKVFDSYLGSDPLTLGKIGYYVTGVNQRKLAKYVNYLRTGEKSENEEEQEIR